MSTILHITNGDTTTKHLHSSKIKGEIITWREMLCEGKTTKEVGSEDFWKTRFEFLKTAHKVSKKNFIDYTLKEYRNLCQQKQQDEIVLWFDNDLFCQVNMLAIISWLKRYRKGRKITLVKTDTLKKQEAFNIINTAFKQRTILSKDDIEYADYIWQLYCSDSPLRLETAYNFSSNSPFTHLEEAIKAHLLRFPSITNGLNNIENTILTTATENVFKSKEALISDLLTNQKIYGFTEIQYNVRLNHLKKLFTAFDPVRISRIGKQVLENQVNYYGKIRSDLEYLGGAKKYSYLYMETNNKLLKITS